MSSTPSFFGYKNPVEATIAFWLWRLKEKGDLPSNNRISPSSPFQRQMEKELGITNSPKVDKFITEMYKRIGTKSCSLETRQIKTIATQAGFTCTLPWIGTSTVSTAVDVKYQGAWETIWTKQ